MSAWRCIGCGRLDAPQTCIGVCQDHRVELVLADDHRAALARERARIADLSELLRLIAATTPHEGRIREAWQALQQRARELLGSATWRT